MTTPVLYSFRRCPYCMRAHMALKYAAVQAELREVELKALPEEVLKLSSQATVPVLQLADGTIMDESWEIVKWAVSQNDPDNWAGLDNAYILDAEMLVETNDFSFKNDLDHYKYADRFPQHSVEHYRQSCEEFLEELEEMLSENIYLLGEHLSIADIAVFPFIRQFSLVDKEWFEQSDYTRVICWLQTIIRSDLFCSAFQKHEPWLPDSTVIYL